MTIDTTPKIDPYRSTEHSNAMDVNLREEERSLRYTLKDSEIDAD